MDNAHPTTDVHGLGWARRAPRTRLRVVPWQGDACTALIGPRRDGRPTGSSDVLQCLAVLEHRGIHQAYTSAMSPADTRPFMAAGFVLQERLHLLSLRLDCAPPAPPAATFAVRRWHRRRVLEIDRAAFDPFWRFDERTLSEAQRATPTSRYRVAREDGCRTGPIAGYAITGRAGPRGYLQRLAVAPTSTGRGYGSLLVADALVWLASRGATMVMVNTQETNGRALALYRRLGFVSEPDGLVVLSWGATA